MLTFDDNNHIRDRLTYSVDLDERGRYTFGILDEEDRRQPIPLPVAGS
ncbi:hypothetical protein ABIA26_001600 [Sinorhizobium fredii]